MKPLQSPTKRAGLSEALALLELMGKVEQRQSVLQELASKTAEAEAAVADANRIIAKANEIEMLRSAARSALSQAEKEASEIVAQADAEGEVLRKKADTCISAAEAREAEAQTLLLEAKAIRAEQVRAKLNAARSG